MPRLKRQSRRRRDELTFEWTFALRTGLIREGREIRKVTDDEAHRWWANDIARESIMDGHMDHHRLGWPSRPWVWWQVNHPGQTPPHCLDYHWTSAARLLDMGELDAAELSRMPRLVVRELKCRRVRAGMDPPEMLASIEALAEQVGGCTQ